MIIGFLRSPRWKTPVMSFIDEYCTVFDDEDENKLEFTNIHNVSKDLFVHFYKDHLLPQFYSINYGLSDIKDSY